MNNNDASPLRRLKNLLIGQGRDLHDKSLYHKISLVALLAWVGMGSDGMSSSCYGPEEAYRALGAHPHLAVFVALATVATILIISASYSQIIEAFPTGGGGYLVASKLLSPTAGVVSGCALLVDYVLTITISVASGADAIFSFLPPEWGNLKLAAACIGVMGLTLLNLRGVRESVLVFVLPFALFVVTHAFVILYALISHAGELPRITTQTVDAVRDTNAELGTLGLLLVLIRSYSMGAGTYTGIEAISNGLSVLREPRVQTAKRAMRYMAVSLAVTVAGLLLTYLLYEVQPAPGRTLNAVLFTSITSAWPAPLSVSFVTLTLLGEAALLLIAAQTGFLDGPRVLANMALDRWFPTRFATLSDRIVNQNGVLLMGMAALTVMLGTRGSVTLLVVLYSINVFITFCLSQLGMVRHWWQVRKTDRTWLRRISVNGVGFSLTLFILLSLSIVKFHEGGWVTLLVTGLLVAVAAMIRRQYRKAGVMLKRLDTLVKSIDTDPTPPHPGPPPAMDPTAKTAIILVNGYNGSGLHTLMAVLRNFPNVYRNFVFVSVGVVDSGNFKGADEIRRLQEHTAAQAQRYVQLMYKQGLAAEAVTDVAIDAVDRIAELAPELVRRYPNSVFFGGQMHFPDQTFITKLLHNSMLFSLQRRLFEMDIPIFVMPIRV